MFNHLTVLFWLGSFKQFILRRCILKSASLIHSTIIYLTFFRHSSDKIQPFSLISFHISSFFSLHSSGDVNVDRSCNIHSSINSISWHQRQGNNGFCKDQSRLFYTLKVHIELQERETIRNLCFTSARTNANRQEKHHVK